MKSKAIGLRVLVFLAVWSFAGSLASAQAINHLALTTSSSDLYLLWAEGAQNGQSCPYNLPLPSTNAGSNLALTGVTAFRDPSNLNIITVAVADENSDQLFVGQLGNLCTSTPVITGSWIPLSNGSAYVSQPTSISVDSSGGIYVIGHSGSNYAYVTGLGQSPSVQINQLSSNLAMAGVAATGSGAIIGSRVVGGTSPGQTTMTGVSPTGTTFTATDTNSYYPAAVTYSSGTGLAYVVSNAGTFAQQQTGAMVSVDSFGSVSNATNFTNKLNPQDAAAYTLDGQNYLAVVGTPYPTNGSGSYGSAQAWNIPLSSSGTPALSTASTANLAISGESDSTLNQQCAVSSDGQVFWYTSCQTNTVGAWSTGNWGTSIPGFNVSLDDSARYIAALTVPEPSSIIALLSLVASLVGIAKKRNR